MLRKGLVIVNKQNVVVRTAVRTVLLPRWMTGASTKGGYNNKPDLSRWMASVVMVVVVVKLQYHLFTDCNMIMIIIIIIIIIIIMIIIIIITIKRMMD